MRIYHTLCLFLICFLLAAQDSYQEDKIYPPAQLQEDFDVLVQSLREYHPAFYEFKSKPTFDAHIEKVRAALTEGMTEAQFHVEVRKLIKEMGCGHTTALPSPEWYSYQAEQKKVLPLSVYILNDVMYINQCPKDNWELLRGAEVLSINNRSASEILSQMKAIQQRDGYGDTYVNISIGRLFSTYHLFLFGQSDSYNLNYKSKDGKEGSIVLKAGGRRSAPIKERDIAYEGNGTQLLFDKEKPNLAILDINNFPTRKYKKDYKSIFQTLETRKIEHLVIDLRDNGGGYFLNGNQLMRYLMPDNFQMKFSRPKSKPVKNSNVKQRMSSKMTNMAFNFMPDQDKSDPSRNYATKYKKMKRNHFDGAIYVLTNGGTFSMGALVTTRMKHDRNATIIGQETGGGENGSYAIINNNLALPNTKVRVVIPYYFLDHDVTPEEKGRGVIPDIIVDYTIEELTSGIDKEIEVVKNKIK